MAIDLEKKKAYNKAWREANPDYKKVWRKANLEKVNAYKKVWDEANPVKVKTNSFKHQYGIDPGNHFIIQNELQNGKCAICGRMPNKSMHRDHNHQTKQLRGMLCGDCNKGLGMFKEDFRSLISAIKYLSKWNEDNEII